MADNVLVVVQGPYRVDRLFGCIISIVDIVVTDDTGPMIDIVVKGGIKRISAKDMIDAIDRIRG